MSSLTNVLANGPRRCHAPDCKRPINKMDECFLDTLSRVMYCERCGVMLRYHRKKALERGEDEPITFGQVDERMARR